MRISLKQGILLAICLLSTPLAYAKAILIITPSLTQTNIRSDGMSAVTYTVTNNTPKMVSGITVFPAFQSKGNASSLSLQNNTCASANLTPGGSCTFRVVIGGANQPASFQLNPRVCAYNNVVCSQPLPANRVNVSITSVSENNGVFAFVGQTDPVGFEAILTSNNTPTSFLFTPNYFAQGQVAVAASTTGKRFYYNSINFNASSGNENTVMVVQTIPDLRIIASVNVAPPPNSNQAINVAILPNDTKVYVVIESAFGSNFGTVGVIDVPTSTLIKTIPVGNFPEGIVVSPDSSKVYIGNAGDLTISVIDTSTDTVVATSAVLPNLNFPTNMAITPDGSTLYVINSDNTVAVINANTLQPIGSNIPVGLGPTGIVVTPDGSKVFVANNNGFSIAGSSVSVIDTATNTVIANIDMSASGIDPYGVAVTPDGTKIFVTNTNNNFMGVINTTDLSFVIFQSGTASDDTSLTLGTFIG